MHKVGRDFRRKKFEYTGPDIIEVIYSKGELHPLKGTEGIDQGRKPGILRVLKQKRRPVGFYDPVIDFSYFEDRINLCRNSFKKSFCFEEVQKIS